MPTLTKQSPSSPVGSLVRFGRRIFAHLTRRPALISFSIVAAAAWVVGRAGAGSVLQQVALVVIGTLLSFVLLPDQPHRLWNVDAEALADTVPPNKLALAGREVTKAMTIQAGDLVPRDMLADVWDTTLSSIEQMASDPRLIVRNLDYRIAVSPSSVGYTVRTDIRADRFLPEVKEVMVSFCSDTDAMAQEYSNDRCVLRERVELRAGEAIDQWVRRVRSYPVMLQIDGRSVEAVATQSVVIGASDSTTVRFIFPAGDLARRFSQLIVTASWETTSAEFPVRFSSYTCVGTTNVSIEVKDIACRIQCNEFFSAVDRSVSIQTSTGLDSQMLSITAPQGSVLMPGSGAIFSWSGRRPVVLQQPQVLLDELPEGTPLEPERPLPLRRIGLDTEKVDQQFIDVMGIATFDAYAKLGLLEPRRMQLRAEVMRRLLVANSGLPDGFEIMVLDAWRSRGQQADLLEHYGPLATRQSFVAELDSEGIRPPHLTGGAVDVTLALHGVPLALGTDYDEFSGNARLTAFEDADGVTRRLRRMLAAAMLSAGFAPYPLEWWHWSYGDDVWAAHYRRPGALFEVVQESPEG